jgi:hypothetical protein
VANKAAAIVHVVQQRNLYGVFALLKMQVERLVGHGRTLKSYAALFNRGALLESDALNQSFSVSPTQMLFFVVIQIPPMIAV